MPTRKDFLAHGLVPVSPNSKSAPDDCPICVAPLTHPVKTPCKHTFDLPCISQWLATGQNTCPLCKREFFTLAREDRLAPARQRQQQLATALQTSNVVSRQPPFQNYGSTEYTLSGLQRSVAMATYALGQGRLPAPGEWLHLDAPGALERVAGPGVLEVQVLSPAFIAMANLLPALAAAQGHPMRDARAWGVVCCALWQELRGMCGRKADVLVFGAVVKEKTRQIVERRAGSAREACLAFFEQGRGKGEWLDTLINFLVLRAWECQQERTKREGRQRETQRLRREALQEPKMKTKCAVM